MVKKLTQQEYITKAIAKHGDKNDYSNTTYVNMRTKIIYLCKKCNESKTQTAHGHLVSGCEKCSYDERGLSRRSNIEEFIEKAVQVHKIDYDYSKSEYTTSTNKLIIKCNNCYKEFQQTPSEHLSGYGCTPCGYIRAKQKYQIWLKENGTRTLFINSNKVWNTDTFNTKALIVHNYKFNYNYVNYINTYTDVDIECPKHGIFKQPPYRHLSGYGCWDCASEYKSLILRDTLEEFIIKAYNTHGHKFDYTDSQYNGTNTEIEIKCNTCTKIFRQKPFKHIYGHGCTYCCKNQTSRSAQEWLHMIQSGLITHLQTFDSPEGEFRIPGTRFSADGYDHVTKTIYEFHGSFWHGDPLVYSPQIVNSVTGRTMGELYQKTQEKKQKCIELGYKYIEIWESQWQRFKKFIKMIQMK